MGPARGIVDRPAVTVSSDQMTLTVTGSQVTQHRHAGPRGGLATDLLRVGAWPRQKRALIATGPSKVISVAALEVLSRLRVRDVPADQLPPIPIPMPQWLASLELHCPIGDLCQYPIARSALMWRVKTTA